MLNPEKRTIKGLLLISLLLLIPAVFYGAYPSFTYQGKLNEGGQPANGTFNIRFALYDDLTTTTQVGSSITKSNVAVTNGLFTVDLDFNPAVFDGSDRYMQISVAKIGSILKDGKEIITYTDLSPRQPVSIAPYSLYSYSTAPHSHWNDSWSGTGTGLTLNSTNSEALNVSTSDITKNAMTSQNTAGAGKYNGYGIVGLTGLGDQESMSSLGFWSAGGAFSGPNGVIGMTSADGDYGDGVLGYTESLYGAGVYGYSGATTGDGNGVRGYSNSINGAGGRFDGNNYGVRASAESSNGVAGYFAAPNGYDVVAEGSGKIKSKADTWIYLNPFNLAMNSSFTGTKTVQYNGIKLTPDAAAIYYGYLPIDVPGMLYGVPFKIASVTVTYKTSNSASFIDGTIIRQYMDDGSDTVDSYTDSTNRTSTSYSTYTITPADPITINNAPHLAFIFNFGGTGSGYSITITTIKVKLVQ